jgi:hypothetical protein
MTSELIMNDMLIKHESHIGSESIVRQIGTTINIIPIVKKKSACYISWKTDDELKTILFELQRQSISINDMIKNVIIIKSDNEFVLSKGTIARSRTHLLKCNCD